MIDKGQRREFGQDTRDTPLTLYEKCHGIFNDHRESGRLIRKMVLFDSIMSPSLYWGIRTHTDHRVSTPAGITNTSSNSNLVFPGGLPSRQWRTGRLEHRELSRWAAVHCGPALCVIYIKKMDCSKCRPTYILPSAQTNGLGCTAHFIQKF